MVALTPPARILIVDDDADAIDLLSHALGELNVAIVGTTDPRGALRLFEECRPDLVLLDLVMPDLDGFQVLKALRATIPAGAYLPILVVTGHPDPAARLAALAEGASDLITKPYDLIEVALRVGNLLQTQALHRQLLRRQADAVSEAREQATQRELAAAHARNEFLSRMSHELRTPLNAILGLVTSWTCPAGRWRKPRTSGRSCRPDVTCWT